MKGEVKETMHKGGSSEVVRRKELLLPITVLAALIGTFVVLLSTTDPLGIEIHGGLEIFIAKACSLFLLVAVLHELIHYITIRALGGQAKIELLLRYGGIALTYDELTWVKYIVTVLAPQIALTTPLLIAWISTSDMLIYAIFVAHAASSIPDVVNAIRIALLHRGCKLKILKERGRIVGYALIEKDGRRIEYYFSDKVRRSY